LYSLYYIFLRDICCDILFILLYIRVTWSWHVYDCSVYALCNTRFIKGHKPSNHIRARIKSHIYTTEWIVYHSTYHVKRYNKASMNVIYYNNDKMSDTEYAEAWNIYDNSRRKLSRAPQGRRLGDERLEVLVLLVAPGELPHIGRNWSAVEYPQKGQEEKD